MFAEALRHHQTGDFRQAELMYRRVLESQPDNIDALNNLGILLGNLGRAVEGKCCFDRAVALEPDNPMILTNYGHLLVMLGAFEEARRYFLKAIEIAPRFAPAYSCLAQDLDYPFTDPHIATIKSMLDSDSLGDSDRVKLNLALARFMDRAGKYDDAFRYCETGKTLKKQLLRQQGRVFDPEWYAGFVDAIIRAYSAGFFARTAGFGDDSELPVFIVGMPRSGTSLVEQILSSHPAVAGAGEIRDLQQCVLSLPKTLLTTTEYPACLDALDRHQARRLAADYLRSLRNISGLAERVTDKVPMNFLHLGFAATLLPLCRVIHCRRDARDTCVSCFFQDFLEGHPFCDLRSIAVYYNQYERLMAHWRRVLPLRMIEVDYEELVRNQEPVSRRLIEFCGLSWHADCLTFHKSPRPVSTASSAQVRRPIYGTSIGRWKYYATHLRPLFDMLDA